MKTPSSLLMLAAVLALSHTARADYEITMTISSPDQPKGQEMVTKVKGDRMRTELGSGNVSLSDKKAGTRFLLKTKTKEAMDLSAFARPVDDSKDKPKPKLTATGKKEKVEGFDAEEYTYSIDDDSKCSLWVASDYPKDKAAALMKVYESSSAKTFAETPDLTALPGPVIRSVVKDKQGAAQIDAVIKSVKEASFDDKEFEVPADYTVKKLPSRPGPKKQPK